MSEFYGEEDPNVKSIFVFYKANTYFDFDERKKLNWDWVGSGGTNSGLYPKEMQFSGPKDEYGIMYHHLKTVFENLLLEGKILRYQLSDKYMDVYKYTE